MKKILFAGILLVIVTVGLLIASNEEKTEKASSYTTKSLTKDEKKAALKKWEATPEGKFFRNWEASAKGKKVQKAANKIMKTVKEYSYMEATITSLNLPKGSRLGLGIMVKIKGEEYILAFGPENMSKGNKNTNNEFEQLHKLKVNDKIKIKSHHVSKAPKYDYPIVSGDYVEKDGKVIYQRVVRKGKC